MKTKSLKELQDEYLPKYLDTPTQQNMRSKRLPEDEEKLFLVSLLAALGSFFVLGIAFLAMAWIINIIL